MCFKQVCLSACRSTDKILGLDSASLAEERRATYTTICLRESKRLVMNLRVLIVTCPSAMIAVDGSRGLQKGCRVVAVRSFETAMSEQGGFLGARPWRAKSWPMR